MLATQIRFRDIDGIIRGGILIEGSDQSPHIICGCCGGVFWLDEEGEKIEILERYDHWVDLSAEIIGE